MTNAGPFGTFLTAPIINQPQVAILSTDGVKRRPTVVTQADGTTHTLQQTASGSGIRYANESQSFVFWSKGDGAFVEEGPSQTETYSNCMGQSN